MQSAAVSGYSSCRYVAALQYIRPICRSDRVSNGIYRHGAHEYRILHVVCVQRKASNLTSAPLAARMSDVAPTSASTDSLNDFACAASARLLSRDDSWCSAMANACSSRLGRRFDSPTSSHAIVHGVAALMTCFCRVVSSPIVEEEEEEGEEEEGKRRREDKRQFQSGGHLLL